MKRFAGGIWEVKYVWLLSEVLAGEHQELEFAFGEHGHCGGCLGVMRFGLFEMRCCWCEWFGVEGVRLVDGEGEWERGGELNAEVVEEAESECHKLMQTS